MPGEKLPPPPVPKKEQPTTMSSRFCFVSVRISALLENGQPRNRICGENMSATQRPFQHTRDRLIQNHTLSRICNKSILDDQPAENQIRLRRAQVRIPERRTGIQSCLHHAALELFF